MSKDHPYISYENTLIWKAIDKALTDLVRNGDLTERTDRSYIVGYLTQTVVESKSAQP